MVVETRMMTQKRKRKAGESKKKDDKSAKNKKTKKVEKVDETRMMTRKRRRKADEIKKVVETRMTRKRKRKVAESKKIINDPIWRTIQLHPLCIKIIDTPQFQRLRSIKQMGGCNFVYPGACHTRFEHSIGTSYLAGVLGRELQKKSVEHKITDRDILCLEVAGLCHDLGHGPFSHLFDQHFIKKARPDLHWTHEDASLKMIDSVFQTITQDYVDQEDIDFIKDLIKDKKDPSAFTKQRKKKPFLYEIISNDLNMIDVDKWDYFSRDCHMLGLHHNFQCERSINLARVVDHGGELHISFPKSEYFNLFDMFYTRFTLHRRACQHPVVKAVEMMITDAFLAADKNLKFPHNQTNQRCLSESVDDMDAYLWVTDDVYNQIKALDGDADPQIKKAKDIVDRIERRHLYKMIGEKRVRWGKKNGSPGDLKHSMESKLNNDEIQDTLFEIQIAVFSYGKGNENPMNNVKLYREAKTKTRNGNKNWQSAVMDEKEISDMFPVKFEQMYIRLYWKGTENDESDREKLIDIFSKIKELQLVSANKRRLKVTLVDV